MKYPACLVILVVMLALMPVASAETTAKIVYEGSTAITDALATKATTTEKTFTLAKASETVMKDLKYPYQVSETEITIVKCRFDTKLNTMGYWITATRGDKDVAVNNPIWIYPAPYLVLVSESYDSKVDEITYTVKEDPKTAMEQVLQNYVSTLPLGKPTTGTKE